MENLPKEGPALLVINHQSYLDPLLVGLPLQRPVSYLARDNLFDVPVVGWILRHVYVIPINREAASTSSLREAIRRLEHGFYVGIFPEGTRTTDGAVGEFKPGLLALVRRTNVPVIPVGVAGAFEAFPKGAWFPRPGKVRVVFGEALQPEELHAAEAGLSRDLLAVLRDRIIACQQAAADWRTGSSEETA
jgi:1-acyl-sn-glycerol-3-phosphate acyltransferase